MAKIKLPPPKPFKAKPINPKGDPRPRAKPNPKPKKKRVMKKK